MNLKITALAFALVAFATTHSAGAATLGEDELNKLKLGVGVSLTYDIGKHDRISSAELDGNNIIRVTKSDNAKARLVLEGHTFVKKIGKVYVGPFVALQPGTDEIIEAIGAGVIFGLPSIGGDEDSKKRPSPFNLAIGVMVDPNVQILGDGLRPNSRP